MNLRESSPQNRKFNHYPLGFVPTESAGEASRFLELYGRTALQHPPKQVKENIKLLHTACLAQSKSLEGPEIQN